MAPPNPRVAKAFQAMKALGISEKKIKTVLKELLNLYQKNWELIEAENYRALADAIFEKEDTIMQENKKGKRVTEDDMEEEEEGLGHEPQRPLKRLRLRGREVNQSPNMEESPGSRAEDCQVSPQAAMKNKGKQPMIPEPEVPFSSPVAIPGNRLISERASHGVRIKEPMAESGSALVLKDRDPDTYLLITPKDEPFDDDLFMNDMPQYEVPMAVVNPVQVSKKDVPMLENGEIRKEIDTMSERDIPDENGETRNQIVKESSSQLKDGEKRACGIASSFCEKETNGEPAVTMREEPSHKLDVATSPLGEVKLFLSCTSAVGKPKFRMPTLDAVIKLTEEKCFHSYKIIDPNFSVMELLGHVCESFLELGTDSVDKSQDGSDGMVKNLQTHDVLKTPTSLVALEESKEYGSLPLESSTEMVTTKCNIMVASPLIPEIQSSLHSTDDHGEASEKNLSNGSAGKNKAEECSDICDSVVVSQCESASNDLRSIHDVNDITKGEEMVKIPWINEVNYESLSSFHYIPRSIVFQNAKTDISLSKIGDLSCCPACFGDCLSASVPCVCSRETGGQFAYTTAGFIEEGFLEECISMARDPQKQCPIFCEECPLEKSKSDDCIEPCKGHFKRKFIKECWSKCGCNKQCGNRVVQRGITRNFQVFFTSDGKGWGLKTLEDLPKGTFVCEYVGEILTSTELCERNMKCAKSRKDTYLALLDADWGSNGAPTNEKSLCLDASQYGNVARFINHRCLDANLIEIPVEVETPDHHYYHLAFFTTRDVAAMEELTWDYGIDFDDLDHPITPFLCRCGSKFCRDIRRPVRSKPVSNSS